MTREEQKAVRKLKQAVEKMLRPCCKKFGYKTILGWVYKVVSDYIYSLEFFTAGISTLDDILSLVLAAKVAYAISR